MIENNVTGRSPQCRDWPNIKRGPPPGNHGDVTSLGKTFREGDPALGAVSGPSVIRIIVILLYQFSRIA